MKQSINGRSFIRRIAIRPRFSDLRSTLASLSEGRLCARTVTLGVLDLQTYLDRLASAQPTPGGGSAAAIVGALGAALVAMVARITLANGRHAAVHDDARELLACAELLRAQFDVARSRDEAAYTAVVAAQTLPRATASEKTARSGRLQAALQTAAEAPLAAAEFALQLIVMCERAARLNNIHVMSDVECALAFGRATLDACAANVRINHRYLTDANVIAEEAERLAAILESAGAHATRAVTVITSG